jgi:hypothetical protein
MRISSVFVLISALILSGCASQTYASGQCTNTLAGWRAPGELGHQVPAYFVGIDAKGGLSQSLWLGYRMTPLEVIDRQALSELLIRIPARRPEPLVILKPNGSANCDEVEAIRTEMNDKLDCKAGQCGEGTGWFELQGGPVVG